MNLATVHIPSFPHHGLINIIDTKAKFRHLKKLTCEGTLRQVFIRFYRLEIQSVMLHGIFDPAYVGIFDPAL